MAVDQPHVQRTFRFVVSAPMPRDEDLLQPAPNQDLRTCAGPVQRTLVQLLGLHATTVQPANVPAHTLKRDSP